jgi:hypothetical protein
MLMPEETAFFNSLVRNSVSQNLFFWNGVYEVGDEASNKGQSVGAAASMGS